MLRWEKSNVKGFHSMFWILFVLVAFAVLKYESNQFMEPAILKCQSWAPKFTTKTAYSSSLAERVAVKVDHQMKD